MPEIFRSSWLTDFSLGEGGGNLNSVFKLELRSWSSLKLLLLKRPTRFFGFTLTDGTGSCKGKITCTCTTGN